MSRLGVLVNPAAGHGRGALLGRDALAALGRSEHEILDLSGASAADALARARAALWEIDALVSVGGDGMAHLGVNAVAGTTVPLGIVPVGSGNDLARNLGLAVHDVPRAVADVLAGLTRAPRRLDVIATQVHQPGQGDDGGLPEKDVTALEWTACVLSAGFDAAVNHRANTYRWPRGGGRYVRGVLAELAAFRPYGYRITIDGIVRELPATLVALANGTSFGGGMRIAPEARMDDGLIDVVIGHAMGRAALLRLFPRVYSGAHLGSARVDVIRAREVILEALPGSRPPPPVYADGELLGRLPIRARLRPGALQILGNA
ncbi:diacylglycerol/lipid kinase family protein [Ruania halotolerans]|uniref:diacylglycerol/lipid kinase family protein n=1 Tax=Ruania halotolerans TaxID=2897773 RepID=UPI001E3143D7|nr:diacylglycerol kinase family protein [Ruania halotolerans]UFU08276.1 diacylglycerol kinase family lipid kinase [Ruania halotolerans]